MDKKELLNRTKKFSLDVINLVNDLRPILSNKRIGYQLTDSGTSVGANYRAACRVNQKRILFIKLKLLKRKLMSLYIGSNC